MTVVLAVAIVQATAGCTESSMMCDCVPAGVQLSAPSGQVQSVKVSGKACESASLRCGGPDSTYRAGCEYYYVSPSAEGECKIDVKFTDGTEKSKTFHFQYSGGECCSGYHAKEDSEWSVTP